LPVVLPTRNQSRATGRARPDEPAAHLCPLTESDRGVMFLPMVSEMTDGQ
jgi:hypothetical protein